MCGTRGMKRSTQCKLAVRDQRRSGGRNSTPASNSASPSLFDVIVRAKVLGMPQEGSEQRSCLGGRHGLAQLHASSPASGGDTQGLILI